MNAKLDKQNKVIALFILLGVVSTGMSSPYFYLNWIIGIFFIIINLVIIIKSGVIRKKTIKLFILSTVWLIGPILALLLNKNVSSSDNIKYIIVYVFHILFSLTIITKINSMSVSVRDDFFLFINKIWIYLNMIILILSIYQKGLINIEFSGIVENRNIFSIYTSLLVSYLMFNIEQYTNKKQVSFLIIMSFILILMTYSVKGFFGWIIFFMFSVVNLKKITIKKIVNTSLLCLLSSLILYYLVATQNPLIERISRFSMLFDDMSSLNQTESAFLRMYYIVEGLKVFRFNSLVGIGIKNSKYFIISPTLLQQGATVGTYSHNGYVEMLLNGGVVSFILYYGLLIYSFTTFFVKKRKYQARINSKYIFSLIIYRLFIDIASVSTENLMLNIVFIIIISFTFIDNSSREKRNHKYIFNSNL